MLAIEPEQRRQEVWAVRQPRRLLVDHFDLVALQYGDIHKFSGFVAAAVLDDQQTGRNHLKHEAKRRQVACGPPDKETLTIAPDTEVYAWAFHGGRKARERLRCERQPSFELQWPLHHIRRNEGERDARHVAFLAPEAGPESRFNDSLNRGGVGQRSLSGRLVRGRGAMSHKMRPDSAGGRPRCWIPGLHHVLAPRCWRAGVVRTPILIWHPTALAVQSKPCARVPRCRRFAACRC